MHTLPVSYEHAPLAMSTFDAEVRGLVGAGARRICDVGGGANPVALVADIARMGIEYVVVDAAPDQLARASAGYDSVILDITQPLAVDELVAERGPFDLVVSRWTAEHVPRGRHFHEQIRRLLRPGGSALHLFPTLYSPVFIVNRVAPRWLASAVIPHVDKSGREPGGRHDAFRPYYSWCRGPTRLQLGRLASVGFVVRRYVGFFGHPYYERLPAVQYVHETLSRWLVAHPISVLTSYGLVVLERDA